jgi:hypothetical protein
MTWLLRKSTSMVVSSLGLIRRVAYMVKLDSVLCTIDWEELYLNCLLQSMATNDSDPSPLYLGLKNNQSDGRHFHFEAF